MGGDGGKRSPTIRVAMSVPFVGKDFMRPPGLKGMSAHTLESGHFDVTSAN